MIILTNPPYFPFASGSFRVSSPYGQRNGSMHYGIDLVDYSSILNRYHNLVMAVRGGTVAQARQVYEKSNKTWEWGKYVAIDQDDGNTVYYCHLSKYMVKRGDKVSAGDIIGVAGNTGYSTGIHLHFEIRKYEDGTTKYVNPAEYLGIVNSAGEIIYWAMEPRYEDEVIRICGLEEQTRKYINQYKYAEDFWRKVYEHLEKD